MAFAHLFRRQSASNESQAAIYACSDQTSIGETLIDELEMQCRTSSTSKRNSIVVENSTQLFPPSSSSKRHASVDYSWLSPQTNLLQVKNESYHLPDIIKMELAELIHNVSPEDCTTVIHQFRRQVRSNSKVTSPENIIAIFRKTLADYIDQKSKRRSSTNDGNSHSTSKTSSAIARHHRVHSDDEQHSIAELGQISLTSSNNNELNESKPRSNTCI